MANGAMLCQSPCSSIVLRTGGQSRAILGLATAIGLLGVSSNDAFGEIVIRDTGHFVVDQAGIVDENVERQIEGWLRELEQKTTAQVKLLTVPTTDGESVFTFTQRHAELWKLGQKGKDNGALVVVAIKEREVRIQTGYGLEPELPDSWCGSLSRDVFAGQFKMGNYSAGVYQGMVAIANKIADASNVKLTGLPDYRYAGRTNRSPRRTGWSIGLPPIILLLVVISMIRRRRYYRRWGGGLGEAIFWGSMLSRGGRGGWGGGFGGSGFGGSFGGGGRFGGGGGGARW